MGAIGKDFSFGNPTEKDFSFGNPTEKDFRPNSVKLVIYNNIYDKLVKTN
jgi:hypothetical protein